MNAHLGRHVLRRSALATFVVMLLLVFVLATRLMMSGVPLSPTVLGLLCALQFPYVATFACGLGTFWLVDDWVRSDAWALLSTSGVSRRRFAVAVLAPGLVLSLWLLVFNVTAFRMASIDGGRALATVQLEDAGRSIARAGVLQVGELRLLARSANGSSLQGVLVAFHLYAFEAREATFADNALNADDVTLLLLDPALRLTAKRAVLSLPEPTSWQWGGRLETDAAGMRKALALALSLPVSMLAAVLCASLGRRFGRLVTFAGWCTLGVGALVGVNAALSSSSWWPYQPWWPVAAFLVWAFGVVWVRES